MKKSTVEWLVTALAGYVIGAVITWILLTTNVMTNLEIIYVLLALIVGFLIGRHFRN